MTTKEYLRQIRTVDKRIDDKLEEVERLQSLRERMTIIMSDMPRGSNGEDRINTITCRIWALEDEINAEIDRLVDLKTEARRRIEAIQDDRYKTLLSAKYLCYQTWEKIAEGMGFEDVRNVYYLHGRALQAFRITA